MNSPSVPLIEVRHVTKAFPQVAALDDLSLTVAKGVIHAILGEDGAGKTSFMRILSGAYPVGTYQGDAFLEGRLLQLHSPGDGIKHHIGTVLRRPSVFEQLSIAENVVMARWQISRQLLVNLQQTRREAQALLDQWGIPLDADQQARRLSPGQQRLILIARALAIEPKVMVLDEPLYGIGEAQSVSRVLHLVRRMVEHRITVVYLARRPNEACQIADRITVLRDGAVAGQWDRESFDEAAMAAVMPSRRPGDIKHVDDDEVSSGGLLGSLGDALNKLMRPGS